MRHIFRMHDGSGEPVKDSTIQYYREANRHNLRFPLDQFHHASISPLTRKEKPDQKFSDLLEDQFLQPLRKMAEFKNLLSELQPSFASTPSSSSNPACHEVSSSNFGDVFCINNISNMFEKPFPPDSWITIGIKARVCENCFNEIYIPIFFNIEGKKEIFEPQHECDDDGLLFSVEEREEILNVGNIDLNKQMMKLIKVWTQDKDCVIVAREVGEQFPTPGEINAYEKDHWSARAIKEKLTTLNNDNEIIDFLAKTNNSTFGMFRVCSSQQQSSAKFYLFMIIKKEWF